MKWPSDRDTRLTRISTHHRIRHGALYIMDLFIIWSRASQYYFPRWMASFWMIMDAVTGVLLEGGFRFWLAVQQWWLE